MPNAGVGTFTRYLIYLYDSPVRCILYGSVVKTGNYGSGCLGSNPSLHHLLTVYFGFFHFLCLSFLIYKNETTTWVIGKHKVPVVRCLVHSKSTVNCELL